MTAAVLSACLLCTGAVALTAQAEEPKSLLLEQSSQGAFTYDATEKSYTAAQGGGMLEINSSLNGANGWVDESGAQHALTELELHYEVRMHVMTLTSDHVVPTFYIAESANTVTYIQNRCNGECFILEDTMTSPPRQTVRKFTGKTISTAGDSYLLKLDYKAGKATVTIDDQAVFTDEALNGNPIFRVTAYTAEAKFSDFKLTTTSPVKNFTKAYPDPAEGNLNLLDVPGYANTARALAIAFPVEINGTTFTAKEPVNSNLLIDNEYLSGSDFYRPDIDEHSDGTDLDFVVSADLIVGKYAEPVQGWFGGGIVFGETGSGYVAARCMQNGNVFVHDFSKTTGDTLYNINQQAGSLQMSEGSKVTIKVYYVGGKLSVLANDQIIVKDLAVKLTFRLGLHASNNAIKVENYSMKFIQPVKTDPAAAKSEESAQFDFERGKLAATAAKNGVSGDISSFTVKTEAEEYFLMNSTARSLSKLYKMTGTESFEELDNSTLTTLTKAKIKSLTLGQDGRFVLVFRHAASGKSRQQLVLTSDKLSIETGSTKMTEAASAPFTAAGDLEIAVYSAEKSVVVYINEQQVLACDLESMANGLGFGGANATYTVEGVSYKYLDDVKFVKPEKETFQKLPPAGEANTEYIEPTLPEKKPVGGETSGGEGEGNGGEEGKGGCSGMLIGSAAAAITALLAAAAVALTLMPAKKAKAYENSKDNKEDKR